MGLGHELRQEQSQGLNDKQRQALNQSQALQLKELQKLKQTLKAPTPDCPVKGWEGIQRADEYLEAHDSPGVLIGSLAKKIWIGAGTGSLKTRLSQQSKDVDVAVLGDKYKPRDLEGHIDWWVPDETRVSVTDEYGSVEKSMRYWENTHGIVLRYGLDAEQDLEPGLHLHGPEWYADMRLAEAMSSVDKRVQGPDEEVQRRFRQEAKRHTEDELDELVQNYFQGRVHHENYDGGGVGIVQYSLADVRSLYDVVGATGSLDMYEPDEAERVRPNDHELL
jgi:hypothetical protein